MQNPQIAVSPVDGAVYVSWRRFEYTSQDNAVMIVKSINGGATFSKPVRVSGLRSFDLVTSATQFRSNGFQTMAIDAHRPRLPGLAGSRLCDGAQRPAHGRRPHRPLDIGDRHDLDGAESDPGGRGRATS